MGLTGWFGKKKRSRDLIRNIRYQLRDLEKRADEHEQDIRELEAAERTAGLGVRASAASGPVVLDASKSGSQAYRAQIERSYKLRDQKIRELDM
jgi:hypothetical protein